MASMDSITGAPRRSTSTASLARHFRDANAAEREISSYDFSNAFWGPNDEGFEVLQSKLRASTKTMNGLQAFWKERALIEEEYSKRLMKLSKTSLGPAEGGELKIALDTLRQETEEQGRMHLELAGSVTKDLESPVTDFIGKLGALQKKAQQNILPTYKLKVSQSSYVQKAKDKYEAECLRINSYAAQTSMVQGKDLDKVQRSLEKAQGSVGSNERDFANFVKALSETTARFEGDWKVFCDQVQDLEEEKIDFLKDNVWTYANAVSQVCVTDDESCEKVRTALENIDPVVDIETFVKNYGTGSRIPDPPRYINFAAGDQEPAQPSYRIARFVRSSNRPPPVPYMESEETPAPVSAAIPAPAPAPIPTPASAPVQAAPPIAKPPVAPKPAAPSPVPSVSTIPTLPPLQTSGFGGPPAPPASLQQFGKTNGAASSSSTSQYQSPTGQYQSPASAVQPTPSSSGPPPPADGVDPVARALAEHQAKRVSRTGSMRSTRSGRSPNMSQPSPAIQQQNGFQPGHRQTPSLVPPTAGHTAAALAQSQAEFAARSNRASIDYSQYGQDLVGAHPSSRPVTPTSPRNPSPSLMQPPAQTQIANTAADAVLDRYQQRFPGETASQIGSVSSRRSRGNSISQEQASAMAAARSPSPSREVFAGVGAGGRSPSPVPFALPSGVRAPSPSPDTGSWQQQQQPPRQPSPAPSNPRHSTYPSQVPIVSAATSRHSSIPVATTNSYTPYAAPAASLSSYAPPAPASTIPQYGAPQQAQQYGGYVPPVQQTGSYYGATPSQTPAATYQQQYQQPQSQTSYSAYPSSQQGYQQAAPVSARAPSPAPSSHLAYQRAASPAPQQHYQAGPTVTQQPQYVRAPSPAPAPAASPGGDQFTDDGKPVVFYVKALYDYMATTPEEFDFQRDDIIAVTSVPEDGWWTGQLMDEVRRVPGRNTFPSNFVAIF